MGRYRVDLIVANSILSIPYYIFLIFWEHEHTRIYHYFTQPIHPLFFLALIFAITLAFSS